ncbi:hypothetical protein [Mesorhizobium sangaii]|uniref:Uncharacterized protein n=1 Tax=Mesorhizobium sangaii TaxID=505389 RepID=A0A841PU52_9HYPH|nr:hypothetical protein [Mesorhizobium sangaii]MBB6413689.1 hypothetical protein [Mesorhizobium sangaii]
MTNTIDQFRDERERIEVLRGEALALIERARGDLQASVDAAKVEIRADFEAIRGQSSLIDRDTIEKFIAKTNSESLVDGYSEMEYPPLTLLDVMTALVCGESSETQGVIDDIHHTILQNIRLDDPWPELTRETVILLIGKRKNKAAMLGFSNIQWHHGRNVPFVAGMPLTYSDGEPLPPLTLAEKLLATRHREWLTAGGSRRRSPKLTAFPPKPVDGDRSNALS